MPFNDNGEKLNLIADTFFSRFQFRCSVVFGDCVDFD